MKQHVFIQKWVVLSLISSSRFVNTFVEHFNLSTSPFIGHNGNAWYYINGRKFKVSEVDSNPDILGFDTRPEEKGKSGIQLVIEAMQKVGSMRCQLMLLTREAHSWVENCLLHGTFPLF